jgi:hypothetical protein
MEKRRCYYVSPAMRNDKNELIPAVVEEGTKGYYPTNWTWGTDLKSAEECAKIKNTALGLSDKDVNEIIISSMF